MSAMTVSIPASIAGEDGQVKDVEIVFVVQGEGSRCAIVLRVVPRHVKKSKKLKRKNESLVTWQLALARTHGEENHLEGDPEPRPGPPRTRESRGHTSRGSEDVGAPPREVDPEARPRHRLKKRNKKRDT